MKTASLIALVDHERESTDRILATFDKLKRNGDSRKLTDAFRFVSIIVEPGQGVATRAMQEIELICGRLPDLILTDLAFGSHESDATVDAGRILARDLRRLTFPVPVGVYTKYSLTPYQRAHLSSDGVSLVLEGIALPQLGAQRMTGDQWSELFEKVITQRGNVAPSATDRFASTVTPTVAERTLPQYTNNDSRLPPETILTAMAPNGLFNIYVVGLFDKTITLYSQQARSLTLVEALFKSKVLQAGDSVGVVGGGPAGLTAAVAAARLGCEAHLFERKGSVLNLQSQSVHRYLHPHIFDWPDRASIEPRAGLPLLDWTADVASSVVSSLRSEATAYAAEHPKRLAIHTGVDVKEVNNIDGVENRAHIVGNNGEIDERFRVVIVAIGFGLDENNMGDAKTVSYWSPDPLQGPHKEDIHRILVSGAGDGGLVDVARATLADFRHDDVINRLGGMFELGERMQEVDSSARMQERERITFNLRNAYDEKVHVAPDLLRTIAGLTRADHEVVLNYRDPGVFSLRSSLINRCLVWMLLRNGAVKTRLGKINNTGIKRLGNGRYRVAIDDVSDDSGSNDFDTVIIRHGPDSNFVKSKLPRLWDHCKEMAGPLAELRLTGRLSQETNSWFREMYKE